MVETTDYPQPNDYWVVASHSDKPINGRIYSPAELIKLGKTYLKPYNKPVLKHHDEESEVLGRVTDSKYIPISQWHDAQALLKNNVEPPTDSSGALLLKLHMIDPEAVKKIEDQRLLNVSIGFSAAKLNCSICGQDWVNDGPCEHEFGHQYDGVPAYGIPGDMKALELSFVNAPADENAQVIKPIEDDKVVHPEPGKSVVAALDSREHNGYEYRGNVKERRVLFTDTVNLAIETSGGFDDTTTKFGDKDNMKESEEKADMKDKVEEVAVDLQHLAEQHKQLESEHGHLKAAVDKMVRMQISNYDALSGHATELPAGADLESSVNALDASKAACDDFLKSLDSESDDGAVVDSKADVSSDANNSKKMVDADEVVSSPMIEAFKHLSEQITEGFKQLAAMIGKEDDDDNKNKVQGPAIEGKGPDAIPVEVVGNSAHVEIHREDSPVSMADSSSTAIKPKTFKEMFAAQFGNVKRRN